MLALVLLVVAQAEIEVEVDARVMRLSQLVRELSEIGGVDLRVATNLANEVVGVASPKRPFREIMDGVAAAANGEWAQDGGGWILRQTKAQAEADQKTETAYRKHRIESFLKTVKVDEPFTEAVAQGLVAARWEFYKNNQPNAQLAALNGRSPATRFGSRVALAIGAARLAEVSPNRTVVFSTQPNERQKPLPETVLKEIYDEFVREQTLYVNAFQPATQRSAGSGGGEVEGTLSQGLEGMEFYSRPPTTASKVLVVATGSVLGGVSMQILMADRAGKVLLRISHNIRPSSSDGIWEGLDKGQNEIVHTGWRRDLLLADKLNPELEAKLLAPADHEPHSIWLEGGIRTWARVTSKPVYVLVPDTMPLASRPGLGDPRPTSTLAAFQLGLRFRCSVDENETRTVVTPKEPVTSRRMRSDRVALQAHLKHGGRARMPEVLSLLRKTNTDQWSFASRQLTLAGRPLKFQPNLIPVLRVAAMGQGSLLPSGSLTFGGMTQAQCDAARFLVYESRNWSRPMETLASEPTEAFPRDLPSNARLTVQSRLEEGALVEEHPDYWTTIRLDDSLDYLNFRYRFEDLKFQWGKFQHYTFTFEAHPLHHHVVRPSDIEELDQESVSYGQLPAAFREALEQRLKERRRELGIDGG